jgi:integrase/recombinase XerD
VLVGTTIADELTAFLLAKESAGRSQATLSFYAENVQIFIAFLESSGVNGNSWLKPETFEVFLVRERRRKLSPATVHARYRALRAFFNWLVGRGRVEYNPLLQVAEPSVPASAPRQVALAEVDRLVDAIPRGDDATWTDARDRLVLVLLFWTGLRLGEMERLAVADVDTKQRLLHVRKGKGGKARYVPFPEGTGSLLLSYLMARPPWSGPELLLSNDGAGGVRGALTGEGIRQMLHRRCTLAGVQYRNPHSFRHGFAMTLLNAGGMEMGVLSKLLGHSSVKTTQGIYADWMTESLRREYDMAQAAIGHGPIG